MTTKITPEMIAAWRTLQAWAALVKEETAPSEPDRQAATAIDALDNANWMVPIEEAGLCSYQVGGSYETPPEYCELEIEDGAEYCPKHQKLSDLDGQLDPAEWGDTTRADMARHQSEDRP